MRAFGAIECTDSTSIACSTSQLDASHSDSFWNGVASSWLKCALRNGLPGSFLAKYRVASPRIVAEP